MLDHLSFAQIFFSLVVVVVAYVVRGITGFGSGLIAIPLLVLNFPLTVIVPLIVTLDYLASASQGLQHREHIKWRELLPLMPFTIPGVALALYLFHTVDPSILIHLLAVFILIYSAYSFFSKQPEHAHTRWWAIPSGVLGGLVGTLFGMGGPFYVIYLQLRSLVKSEFRATFSAIFMIDGFYRIFGYLVTGFYTVDLLLMLAVLLPVMSLSLYFGGRIHTGLSQNFFKRGISIMLFGSGVALFLR